MDREGSSVARKHSTDFNFVLDYLLKKLVRLSELIKYTSMSILRALKMGLTLHPPKWEFVIKMLKIIEIKIKKELQDEVCFNVLCSFFIASHLKTNILNF